MYMKDVDHGFWYHGKSYDIKEKNVMFYVLSNEKDKTHIQLYYQMKKDKTHIQRENAIQLNYNRYPKYREGIHQMVKMHS